MPTSSQAMIIQKRELDEILWQRTSARTISPCPVKSIDLNELFEKPFKELSVDILQRVLKKRMQSNGRPSTAVNIRGYKTILSYDTDNGGFSWKYIREDPYPRSSSFRTHSVNQVNKKAHADKLDHQNLKKTRNSRPKSVSELPTPVRREDEIDEPVLDLPEDILSLGFRSPHRMNSASAKKSATRRVSAPTLGPHAISPKSQISSGTFGRAGVESWIVIPSRAEEEEQEIRKSQTFDWTHNPIDEKDLSSSYDDEKYEDLCLPSTCFLKKLPEKRPLVVCFSLRENEEITHEQLKTLIKEKSGLEIDSLQYEPLSICTGDPSVNGRWLASMKSDSDVKKIIRSGFFMGKDHIIVKSLDDINERGYRNNNFINALREERKRLKMSQSSSAAQRKPARHLPPKHAHSTGRHGRI